MMKEGENQRVHNNEPTSNHFLRQLDCEIYQIQQE